MLKTTIACIFCLARSQHGMDGGQLFYSELPLFAGVTCSWKMPQRNNYVVRTRDVVNGVWYDHVAPLWHVEQ